MEPLVQVVLEKKDPILADEGFLTISSFHSEKEWWP